MLGRDPDQLDRDLDDHIPTEGDPCSIRGLEDIKEEEQY